MATMSARATIRVGVAGWDYPDWSGIVYPANAGGRFDRLAWIARFVDVVEINATFYRPAAPRTAASWLRRTAEREGFRFTAKSHRSWTHELADDLPRAVRDTLDGLRPLREGGRLGALLVQFPHSFRRNRANLDHVVRLAEHCEGWPLVVELRRREWSEEAVFERFSAAGVGWCVVDQPAIDRTTVEAAPRATSPVGYLRLHGRNARAWFDPAADRDRRYDYLYSREELRATAALVETLAADTAEAFVVQNNHFRGQALANALQLRRLVEGERAAAPQGLVDAYPELEADVRVRRERLF